MKVLFINPPSVPHNLLERGFALERPTLRQTVAMPMGILYLGAVLKRDLPGVRIEVCDLALAYRHYADDPERQESTLHSFISNELANHKRPDLIGISILFSTAHKTTLKIAQAAKALWPDVPIIVGGMHATNAVPQLLECEAIDYVCRGEAESAIAAMLTNLATIEQVSGVIGRAKLASGKLDACPLIYDLDKIPLPAWDLIPMEQYVAGEASRLRSIDKIEQDREATIVTTRGCPFHCTFCASWTVHGREMRYRSTENVMGELRLLRECYGVTSVIPEDDLFTVKKPRILELCAAVQVEFGRGMHFQFPNGLSVATLDEDVIRAMGSMGMTVANIAVESGSDYVQRKIIKKNVNLDRARRVVQACRDAGIVVRAYFILGFPGETKEQMRETIDFAASLPADWCVFNIAAPLIGTEMYEQLLERGEIDATFNWDDAFFHERAYGTPEATAQEVKDMAMLANLRVNFLENYNLRAGNPARAREMFLDIIRAYPDHAVAYVCLGAAEMALGNDEAAMRAAEQCDALLVAGREMAVSQDRLLSGMPIATTGPWIGTPAGARELA